MAMEYSTLFTQDHMILCLQRMYPSLNAGTDYRCFSHIGDDGNRTGDPEIGIWRSTTVKQPTNQSVKEFYLANAAVIRSDYIRQFRDMELAATDGFANVPADAPPSVQAKAEAWKAYRQALRDVTNQPSFPFDITVPQRPDGK
ncbi:TPA: hypothetical protein QDB50_005345 [Burkholderia vietnamiensis]|nr:hypothetical protein [Burkholderia vietnamiensis]